MKNPICQRTALGLNGVSKTSSNQKLNQRKTKNKLNY